MNLQPTTELEAVNELLKAVGEVPVDSLETIGFTDAAIARDQIRTTSRELQTRGWYFNKDDDYAFTPGADGIVVLPQSVISIRPARSESRRITPRAGKLYNADASTFVFSPDAPPVVNVTWLFPFEELPESARRYITVHAATVFQTSQLGSDQLFTFTREHEKAAADSLQREEREYEEPGNFFNDSNDVLEIWQR